MKTNKKIDLVRQINANLSEELDNKKFELEYHKQLNSESYKKAKELIIELEEIKEEWLRLIKDLTKSKEQYSDLILEVKELKDAMEASGFKIPLYKKLFIKIRKLCENP